MDGLVVAAKLALAATFAAAAVAKLVSWRSFVDSMTELGVRGPARTPAGVGVPAVELAVAVLLLPGATAAAAALTAAVLLVAFSALIVANLARNRRPRCNCFGQLSRRPIGWRSLARNLSLTAVASFVVAREGGPGVLAATTSWVDQTSAAVVAAALSTLAVLLFGVALVVANGLALRRSDASMEPLPPGSPLPEFTLLDLAGTVWRSRDILDGESSTLLVFVHPGCEPCLALLPEVADWQHSSRVPVRVLAEGSYEQNRAIADDHSVDDVFLHDGSIGAAFGIDGTPAAVLVTPSAWTASPIAAGAPSVRDLALSAADRSRATTALPGSGAEPRLAGDPAPRFHLSTADAGEVDSSFLSARVGVALYLDPDCGFCRQMLPRLREWEQTEDAAGVRLLALSTGSAQASRWLGLKSPVALDERGEIGRAFGFTGTPSAVIVDAAARVASPPAVGIEDVLELLEKASGLARLSQHAERHPLVDEHH